jgi:nicotinate-nucleotide pyrophosphorylase (carboxylating)
MDRKEMEKGLLRLALAEDVGPGDITTAALRLGRRRGEAVVVSKAEGIISGIPQFRQLYRLLSRTITVRVLKHNGSSVVPGDIVLIVRGALGPILVGERTAMNILGHLSGVATAAHRIAADVADLPVKILDTRKTMPGMRHWEKAAVRHGGAANHRLGLFDMYLIKENHIAAAGGLEEALSLIAAHKKSTRAKAEVEVANLDQLATVLNYRIDYVLLDNFDEESLKAAVALVKRIRPGVILEASGNVNRANVRRIAQTGVDRISLGSMTHSAPALDLSMKVIGRE